jgi:hypothetical protein
MDAIGYCAGSIVAAPFGAHAVSEEHWPERLDSSFEPFKIARIHLRIDMDHKANIRPG